MLESLYIHFLKYPSISTDTRTLKSGDIFFALKGDNFNGNQYVSKALEMGASLCVCSEPQPSGPDRIMVVDDVLVTLSQLATLHRERSEIPVIGITGSNGKTTTKELVSTVLSSTYSTHFTKGNLNNHIGVPLTLLQINADHQFAVVEMGANHQGEIKYLSEIAKPDYGLITNCGKAHLEGFGGFEGVIQGKTELYRYLASREGLLFVNGDDPLLLDKSKDQARIRYGKDSSCEVRGKITSTGPMLAFSFYIGDKEWPIKTNLVGIYNFPNAMAAVAIGLHFGVQPAEIVKAIEGYTPSNHRSQWVDTGKNQVVIDAYNANPTSMEAALNTFSNIESDRRRLIIMGEMRELGIEGIEDHMRLAALASEIKGCRVIMVGEGFKAFAQEWYPTSMELLDELMVNPVKEHLILVKGSRGNRLEVILPAL